MLAHPNTAGSLTAIVHTDGVTSAAAVQVATVTPVVTASVYAVAANATMFTFKGFGFDPTAAYDTVVLSDGAVATVATANSTAMTVKFTTDPTTEGSLTAIVTVDNQSSGAPVRVGIVTPVVTASTANLAANASQIIIKGFGFDSTPANNKVLFNDGAVGTVTTATTSALTVTFTTKPATAGSLTAIVTTGSVSSGTAVQVATVTPVVTASSVAVSANPFQMTIHGFGFDPTAADNTVTFNRSARHGHCGDPDRADRELHRPADHCRHPDRHRDHRHDQQRDCGASGDGDSVRVRQHRQPGRQCVPDHHPRPRLRSDRRQ